MPISYIETASLDTALNAPTATALSTASGSAPSYSARAWVNFNGTGTVAIRASGNVSSITDSGTGDYTVNFTTAMADANYAAVTGQLDWTTFGPDPGSLTYSTTAVRFLSRSPSTAGFLDRAFFAVAIFR
jgi:hypothetical protein